MDHVAKVTPSDVARVTARYFDPRSDMVIVVGDRKKIEPEIQALHLGPVKTFSVDDISSDGRQVQSPGFKVQSRLPPRMNPAGKKVTRRRPRSKAHNLAWAIFFFILGVIGVMVPIMPQIPFFVMSVLFLSLVFPSVRRKLRRFLHRHPKVAHAYKKWRDKARRKRQAMIRREKEIEEKFGLHPR